MKPVKPARIKLVIAFDGSAYQGWQRQRSGTGVQQVVEGALAKLVPGGPHRLVSSSRTDAGVHALGLVVSADLPPHDRLTPLKLRAALNAFLPDDVRVVESPRAAPDFDARFDATAKQYRYFVWNHPVMNPLLRGRAWHVPAKLDYSAVKRAARLFQGTHDFRAFTANRGPGLGDSNRTLTLCRVVRSGPQISFVIEGSGFLYKMCRGIVGTLVQAGQGRFGDSDIRELLTDGSRSAAGVTAPAEGLVLWKVSYSRKAKVSPSGSSARPRRAPTPRSRG